MAQPREEIAAITELLSKLGLNASMADVTKLIPKDPAKLDALAGQLKGLEKPVPNMDTFNWDTWGNDGPDHKPGTKPVFMLYCYDDKGCHRIMEEVTGLPTAKFVLKTLKRAIAAPKAPQKPALPWQLCVSLKLNPQFSDPAVKSFLSTLPKPFHWRYETEEERTDLADGIEEKNQEGSRMALDTATKKKTEGNAAYAKKDAATAITAYSDAIDASIDAFAQKTDEMEGPSKELLAICYANRAAAYLLPGKEKNASKAREDGEEAERLNPVYANAYMRQAAAREALGDIKGAKQCLERGLSVEKLRSNGSMKKRLRELERSAA